MRKVYLSTKDDVVGSIVDRHAVRCRSLMDADIVIADGVIPSAATTLDVRLASLYRKPTIMVVDKASAQPDDPLLALVSFADLDERLTTFLASPTKGSIITFEGGDGTGKKTQTALLYERFLSQGIAVRTWSFPRYGAHHGQVIRRVLDGAYGGIDALDPALFAGLYAEDRAAVAKGIAFWRDAGYHIILDRYAESNRIHQAANAPEGSREGLIASLDRWEHDVLGIPRSDAVIYLDLPPSHAHDAMDAQGRRKDILENDQDHASNAYLIGMMLARRHGWKIIECLSDGVRISPHGIHGRVISAVGEYVPLILEKTA
ncbi:MAG: hypothetical protein ABIH41_02865 [Nanoarchaeota archaeon]